MSWKFRVDHTAIVKDAQGRWWKIEIKPDSFDTFSWVARPIQWAGDITISSGRAAWSERQEAQRAAAWTLSAMGFTDE